MAHPKRTRAAQQLQMQWPAPQEPTIQVPRAVEQELLSALAGLLHSVVEMEVRHEPKADR